VSARAATLAVFSLIVIACASATPGGTPTASRSSAPTPSSQNPTLRPTATPPPALVGTWVGFHTCQRIVDIMGAAGMPEQGLLNVAESGTIPGVSTVDQIPDPSNPCVDTVEVEHSHFFTAGGLFGSRDSNGQQVDDGRWRLVDADTVEINGTPFEFEVDGDELRMQPVAVGTCPAPDEWCPEAWKLMVAMPGMAWTRG
jgi:hypothetical protein